MDVELAYPEPSPVRKLGTPLYPHQQRGAAVTDPVHISLHNRAGLGGAFPFLSDAGRC